MGSKKNKKNVIYSVFSQTIVLVIGMLIPRIILKYYGSDTNGFVSTITQIITYVALLEAGIGQATRNELYNYINGDKYDKNNISIIMSISRRSYRDITKIYALAILVLSLILPIILKTDLNYYTIFAVTMFEGFTGVISFFFIQNWTTLLAVDGKQYVVSNIELINKIIFYSLKMLFAFLGMNIVIVEASVFIASMIKLLIYKKYMDRNYSWVNYKIDEGNRKLKDRESYILTEVAWTIFSSTDMIILSVFVSTKEASVYSIYNMIFVAINGFINAVYMSLKFNLGQSYHNSIESYKRTHDIFNSVFVGIISAVMSITYILCIPFVSLYTRGVQDINYINPILPMGFCLIQIFSWGRMISGNLSGLAGHAKKVSRISLVEAILNISLSIVLVFNLGVEGVLIATVIALPLKLIYCNWLADKVILQRSSHKTIIILSSNFALFLIIALFSSLFKLTVESYISFFVYSIILMIAVIPLFICINAFVNRDLLLIIKKKLNRG